MSILLVLGLSVNAASDLKGKLESKLVDTSGKKVKKDYLKSKKMYVFYFSASWCGPCKAFTPQLNKWYKSANKEAFELILASADRDKSSMLKYMKKSKMTFPGLPPKDVKSTGVVKFAARGIPFIAVVDASGKVVKKGDAYNMLTYLKSTFSK